MKHVALAFAVCLLLATLSCRNGRQSGGTFIDAPGTFELFRGRMTVTVTQNTNGAVNYRVKHDNSVSGPSRPQLRAGQPWFIFPETATNVWIYDGRSNLTMIAFGDGGARTVLSQRSNDLWKALPQPARDRLPPELRTR